MLLESGARVRLGNRAFEILLALVERAGDVVSKQQLISLAWPGLYVESSNLRVHVAALRRMLRDPQHSPHYIRSVTGRGYVFIAPVVARAPAGAPGPAEPKVPLALPAPTARLIGRAETVAAVTRQLALRRMVSIVGPGGIGKSTVALAAAERLVPQYQRRVCFVDLSVIDDSGSVPTALATALGASVLTSDPIGSLTAFLRDLHMLIVVDNCEHVIEGTARLIEPMLRRAARVDILLTSREPLLVPGESVYRLEALRTPPPTLPLSAAEALGYPAVELFVERASDSFDEFALTDENAVDVGAICARLDGIPLAIELAAARVGLLGVRGLLTQLDGRLLLLSKGRRTAQPRHRSLRALLDWSYETLSPVEQTVLRRTSVFRGSFSPQSAAQVISDDLVSRDAVETGLTLLAAKSLLSTQLSGDSIAYRFLQTTRSYAFERLERDPAEQAMTARRHAEHLCSVLTLAQADWETMPRAEWIFQYGGLIDDVRAALDWAFAPVGDAAVGASLTAVSLPFGFQLAQIDEFLRRCERALQTLASLRPARPEAELRLTTALAVLQWNAGARDERVAAGLISAAALADRIGIAKLKVEPAQASAIFQVELGHYAAALEACQVLAAAAEESRDPLAALSAERAAAQAHHFAGDHVRARALANRVLRHPARAIPLAYSQASVDKNVSMRIVLARISWLEGHPDRASETAQESLRVAASDGPFAMCQALALAAAPVALWRGDLTALTHIEDLLRFSLRYTLQRWHTLALCFKQSLPEGTTPSAAVRAALGESQPVPASTMQRDLLATIDAKWFDESTASRASPELSGWCAPELLRLLAEVELRGAAPARDSAEARLRKAVHHARQQGALAWELRASTTLCHLLHETDRNTEARALLSPVYARFTQGHDTHDLRAAASLLEKLHGR